MARKTSPDPLVPFPVRLPESLAIRLRQEAQAKDCTNSDVFRSYIRLADAKPLAQPRPRPSQKQAARVNRADPELLRQVAQIGSNLNQISRSLNASDQVARDAVSLLEIQRVLICIRRQLEGVWQKNAD